VGGASPLLDVSLVEVRYFGGNVGQAVNKRAPFSAARNQFHKSEPTLSDSISETASAVAFSPTEIRGKKLELELELELE
jgi:hypothetical protein